MNLYIKRSGKTAYGDYFQCDVMLNLPAQQGSLLLESGLAEELTEAEVQAIVSGDVLGDVSQLPGGRLAAGAISRVVYAQPEGNAGLRPRDAARLHGDLRALLQASTTQVSIHNTSGIISNAAGRLFGFLVIDPGATPTLTVHDNAGAASGAVLKTALSTEWAAGAWLYCGPDGVAASNGLYLTLGGGANATVLAVFEGTIPAPSFTGTEMWFDGLRGSDSNNGLSLGAPRQTLTRSSGDFDASDWRIYIRYGTTVVLPATTTHDMLGTNTLVEAYGDPAEGDAVIEFANTTGIGSGAIAGGSAYTPGTYAGTSLTGGTGSGAVATITVASSAVSAVTITTPGTGYTIGDVLTASVPGGSGFTFTVVGYKAGSLASLATSGVAGWRNVKLKGSSTFNIATNAIACNQGARLWVENVSIVGKFNLGVAFSGNAGRIADVTFDDTAYPKSAIYGGASSVACPNRTVIHRCTVYGEADAFTLHDGNVLGVANAIVGCTLNGGTENAIDILGGYARTVMLGNRVNQGTSFAIGVSNVANGGTGGASGGTVPIIVANDVRHSAAYGLVTVRQAGLIAVGNYCEAAATGGGPVFGLYSGVTGALIAHNTIWGKAGGTRNVLEMAVDNAAGSSGVCRNNLLMSDMTSSYSVIRFFNATNFGAWTVSGNYYRGATPRWSDGTTAHTVFANWNATAADDVGHSTTAPALVDSYKLPAGSALIGAGVSAAPVAYLGLSGVVWQYGAPSVGCDEATDRAG